MLNCYFPYLNLRMTEGRTRRHFLLTFVFYLKVIIISRLSSISSIATIV